MVAFLDRTLHIDSPVPPREGYQVYQITTAEEARDFVSDVLGMCFPVHIDAQRCSQKVFSVLLPFLEEYGSSIEMIANDPVPITVLSRFRIVNVTHMFPENDFPLESLRWTFQPISIKARLEKLFKS